MATPVIFTGKDPYGINIRQIFLNSQGESSRESRVIQLGERIEGLFQNGYGMSDVMSIYVQILSMGKLTVELEDGMERIEVVDKADLITKEEATRSFEQVAQKCFSNRSGELNATQKITIPRRSM